MRETSKSLPLMSSQGAFQKYLNGSGIDVGAGSDPLPMPRGTGTCRPWDTGDGEASELPGVEARSLDFLYSSHCLEHLVNVERALHRWAEVVRTGGYLYVVVPDYALYEQLSWPSRFNADHRHSFSLELHRSTVRRPNHWHFDDLVICGRSAGLRLISADLQDEGYDYNNGGMDQTLGAALAQIRLIWRA